MIFSFTNKITQIDIERNNILVAVITVIHATLKYSENQC